MELTVDFAAPADDAGIRGLLRRQAMPGRISLAFPRDPDFSLGCAITGDDYKIVVARAADEIVGVACRSVRHVFINGRPERLGYLARLERAGGIVLTGVCFYVMTPKILWEIHGYRTILTNSAKLANIIAGSGLPRKNSSSAW